jgi:hypothetical protein
MRQDKRIEIPASRWGRYALHREGTMAKKSAQIIEIRKMAGKTGLIIIEKWTTGKSNGKRNYLNSCLKKLEKDYCFLFWKFLSVWQTIKNHQSAGAMTKTTGKTKTVTGQPGGKKKHEGGYGDAACGVAFSSAIRWISNSQFQINDSSCSLLVSRSFPVLLM